MSVESWKTLCDIVAVAAAAVTFFAGAGALWTGSVLNKRQGAQLRQFDKDLTGAKTDLTNAQRGLIDANSKSEAIKVELQQEMQKTAIAQRATADAQLLLNSAVTKQIMGRIGDDAHFTPLKDFPKATVEIAYEKADSEAVLFGENIANSLRSLGWEVREPSGSLPIAAAKIERNMRLGVYIFATKAPARGDFGVGPPLTPGGNPVETRPTRLVVLQQAIEAIRVVPDSSLPDGLYRILVIGRLKY